MDQVNTYMDTPYGSIRLWVKDDDPFIPALKKMSMWSGHDKSDGGCVSFEFDKRLEYALHLLGYDKDYYW